MRQKIALALGAVLAMALAAPVSAYVLSPYSGIDINGDPFTALGAIPNSLQAESAFKRDLLNNSRVHVIGSEDLEKQPLGAPAGGELTLDLGVAGTVKLKSRTGAIAQAPVGDTNGFGRYSVPGGTRFWDDQAGGQSSFSILFDRDMTGFGFYGTDIGDLTGTLSLVLFDANDLEISRLAVPTASRVIDADGSVLYFGLIAESSDEFFRRISFVSSSGFVDGFGFDSFTVGSAAPSRVPEPGTLLLVACAALSMLLARRSRA